MKTKKNFEKVANIDLDIHKNATTDEWERYDAALTTISYLLFKDSIGTWGGRETCMGIPEDGWLRTNYWFVLESGLDKAKQEIERIIRNFNLSKFTKLTIGEPSESKTDYKTKFKKEESMKWSWYK